MKCTDHALGSDGEAASDAGRSCVPLPGHGQASCPRGSVWDVLAPWLQKQATPRRHTSPDLITQELPADWQPRTHLASLHPKHTYLCGKQAGAAAGRPDKGPALGPGLE